MKKKKKKNSKIGIFHISEADTDGQAVMNASSEHLFVFWRLLQQAFVNFKKLTMQRLQ